jgi:hypothetical protein
MNLVSQLAGRHEDESLGLFERGVELLKDRDGEGGGLAGAGLSLSNDIVTLDDWENRISLDGGRAFETGGEKSSSIIDQR